ncbi:hypothetical protein LTR40_009614, partial [Exophiala xenobiotica]
GFTATGGTENQKLKMWDTRTFWHLVFFRVPDYPELLIAGREREFWTQWMRSEMRDPSALTPEDIDEYARWTALPGGMRAICEGMVPMSQRANTNTELMKQKLQMPILAVGGDFFFGEVPQRQMEKVCRYTIIHIIANWNQVGTNVTGAVIHSGHNIALEKPEDLARAYLDFFDRF